MQQEKLSASKTPQNSNKGENRVAKRKLYSPSGVLADDEGAYCRNAVTCRYPY